MGTGQEQGGNGAEGKDGERRERKFARTYRDNAQSQLRHSFLFA